MEPVVDDRQIRRVVAGGELMDGLHDQPDQQHHGEDPPRTRPAASLAQPGEPVGVDTGPPSAPRRTFVGIRLAGCDAGRRSSSPMMASVDSSEQPASSSNRRNR